MISLRTDHRRGGVNNFTSAADDTPVFSAYGHYMDPAIEPQIGGFEFISAGSDE